MLFRSTAVLLSRLAEKSGMPFRYVVAGTAPRAAPGAAPGGANALPGASAPNVNALGTGGPVPKTPVQERDLFNIEARARHDMPVAVIDPDTKETIYVSREEAARRRMTPADKSYDLTPKQIQTLEAKYPQATSSVKAYENSSNKLESDLLKLAKHPGLSGISGLVYGRTPAITAAAREALAL